MAILPFEQLTQRRDAIVAAPGVILWSSTTNLWTQEIINTNVVTEGEVELAQMAPPEFFWDILTSDTYSGYDEGTFDSGGEYDTSFYEVDGISQDYDAIGNEWYVEHGSLVWGEGAGEDGVYP